MEQNSTLILSKSFKLKTYKNSEHARITNINLISQVSVKDCTMANLKGIQMMKLKQNYKNRGEKKRKIDHDASSSHPNTTLNLQFYELFNIKPIICSPSSNKGHKKVHKRRMATNKEMTRSSPQKNTPLHEKKNHQELFFFDP